MDMYIYIYVYIFSVIILDFVDVIKSDPDRYGNDLFSDQLRVE